MEGVFLQKKMSWKKSAQKKMFWLIMPFSTAAFIILGFIWIMSSKRYVDNSLKTSHRLALKSMQQTADMIFDNFDKSMTTIVQDVDVINLAVVPNFTDYARNRRVILKLNAMEGVGCQKRLSLYLPWLDAVFSSDLNICPFPESSVYHAVLQYDEEYGELSSFGNGAYDKSRIVCTADGEVYVVQSFPLHDSSKMYTILIEVDKEELFEEIVGNSLTNQETVVILTEQGRVLMSSDESYKPADFVELSRYPMDGGFGYGSSEEGEIHFFRSEYSGLYLMICMKDSSSEWAKKNLFGSVAAFLLMAVFQFVCANVSVSLILGPIEKLVNHILSLRFTLEQETLIQQKEFGYLNKAYEQIAEHQLSEGKQIPALRQMILNRLVLSFYSEVVLSEAEKKSLYDFLSMDSEKQKRYYLMLLRTAEGSETLFEQQDQNRTFLELSAKSILENGQQEIRYPAAVKYGRQCIYADDKSVIFLFSYESEEACAALVKAAADGIQEQLGEALGLNSIVVCSRRDIALEEMGDEIHQMKITAAAQEYAAINERLSVKADEMKRIQSKYEQYKSQISDAVQPVFTEFDETLICELLEGLLTDGEAEVKHTDLESRYILYVFKDVCTELSKGESAEIQSFLEQEMQILNDMLNDGAPIEAVICRACLVTGASGRRMKRDAVAKQHGTMRKVLSFIEAHYTEGNFGLTGIAEVMGIHSSYLSRQFKEIMGQNFVSYMNQYKIEKAQFMLLDTSLAVNEISEAVGFTTIQHFMKSFKKITGYSPGAYRNHFSTIQK